MYKCKKLNCTNKWRSNGPPFLCKFGPTKGIALQGTTYVALLLTIQTDCIYYINVESPNLLKMDSPLDHLCYNNLDCPNIWNIYYPRCWFKIECLNIRCSVLPGLDSDSKQSLFLGKHYRLLLGSLFLSLIQSILHHPTILHQRILYNHPCKIVTVTVMRHMETLMLGINWQWTNTNKNTL